jgi:transporter family-2 protein
MHSLFSLVLAFVAGACAPTQAGINSQLRQWTGDAAFTAFVSFFVGTACLLVWVLVRRVEWPDPASVGAVPWWQWTGGLLGAYLVSMTIILAPKLGATTLMAVLVTGQLVTGLILDHYGLIGYPVREINVLRLAGVILLFAGVMLVRTQ